MITHIFPFVWIYAHGTMNSLCMLLFALFMILFTYFFIYEKLWNLFISPNWIWILAKELQLNHTVYSYSRYSKREARNAFEWSYLVYLIYTEVINIFGVDLSNILLSYLFDVPSSLSYPLSGFITSHQNNCRQSIGRKLNGNLWTQSMSKWYHCLVRKLSGIISWLDIVLRRSHCYTFQFEPYCYLWGKQVPTREVKCTY